MKILVWQTAYLGDVVLTTPLVRTLRENFPKARITFVGRSFVKDIFDGWQGVEYIVFEKSFRETLKIIGKLGGFDVAIVPHRGLRSALVILLSGIKVRIGFENSEFPLAFTHRVKYELGIHEVERNLKLLEPLGVRKFVRETFIPVPRNADKIVEKYGLSPHKYVVFCPWTHFPLKRWEKWEELANLVRRKVKVVVCDSVRRDFKASEDVLNLTGRTSLKDFFALLRFAKAVVSNDSAPAHCANALGTPALVIYTATSPHYGFWPLKGAFITSKTPCSPCSPAPKRCRIKNPVCKVSVDEKKVAEKLFELIDGTDAKNLQKT